MMTEAMKPLGLTIFQELMKRITGSEMPEMGGRLYMDISNELASPLMSKFYLKSLVTVDVLMQKALYNLMKRKDFVKNLYRGKTSKSGASMWLKWGIDTVKTYRRNDPEILRTLIFGPVIDSDWDNAVSQASADDHLRFTFSKYSGCIFRK